MPRGAAIVLHSYFLPRAPDGIVRDNARRSDVSGVLVPGGSGMAASVASRQLFSYLDLPDYARDLDAVRTIWSEPTVLATSGALVFLTYLTLPNLLAVRPPGDALARPVLDGERERRFLLRVLGLDASPAWRGGIENARTRQAVGAMSRHHRRFPGMRQEYLDFIAAVIALAPLRVRDRLGIRTAQDERGRYWRYMSCALSLLGTSLDSEGVTDAFSESFAEAHARPSADGRQLLISLNQHHSRYVRLAIPSLCEASRLVTGLLLEDLA